MSTELIIVAAIGGALLGPRLFRRIVGYRCPACRRGWARLNPGLIQDTFSREPPPTYWTCRECRVVFVKRGNGPMIPTK